MICLDTNIVIAFLAGKPQHLVERLRAEFISADIALPVPVLHELYYGAAKSMRPHENRSRICTFLTLPITVLQFEAEDAEEAGEIRAVLARAGTPIGPYDILIAAQARRRKATLVTANVGEFTRVSGLAIENWMAS